MDDTGECAGAREVVKILQAHGFRALWAGGCVRDMLMGRVPHDFDIASNASPREVVGIFPNAREVGAHFGVVTVRCRGFTYEVARFRRDLGYSDGRHPDRVEFCDEVEDARRRDFTLNGMFFDPVSGEVLDYVGGRADLARKVIRAIGDPFARFSEDRLRMLRAIRFGARFGMAVADETWAAMSALSPGIGAVSTERIRDELVRILTEGGARPGIRQLVDVGLMAHIVPEVLEMDGVPQPPEFHPEGDVLTHTLIMLGLMRRPSAELALGVLLHDIGKPRTFEVRDRIRFNKHPQVGAQMAEDICCRLRFSSHQIQHIAALVAHHHRFVHVKQMRPSKLKRFLRLNRFEDHLELHRLDCLSSHRMLDNYQFCKQALENLPPDQINPEPLVNGKDLIALGYHPGPVFKRVLSEVEDAQLEGSVVDRTSALELAVRLLRGEETKNGR